MLNEFILVGITDFPLGRLCLDSSSLFTSVGGNLGLIILTTIDSRLHTPMYFFLRHLAFTDLGYSTAVGPKMLVNFAIDQHAISCPWCVTQLTFFSWFITSEIFILSAMAYDCYVAICNPLHHGLIKSPQVCVQLVTASWVSGVPVVTGQTW